MQAAETLPSWLLEMQSLWASLRPVGSSWAPEELTITMELNKKGVFNICKSYKPQSLKDIV